MRHRSLHRCATSSAFVVAPPRLSLSRRRSLPCRAAGFAFVIAPPPVLNLSLRRCCLPCCAAAALVIALPLASSLRYRSIIPTSITPNRFNCTPLTSLSGIAFSTLCCCHQPKTSYCATAAFLAPPLTSSSSRHSLYCRTTFPSIVAPPVLLSSAC